MLSLQQAQPLCAKLCSRSLGYNLEEQTHKEDLQIPATLYKDAQKWCTSWGSSNTFSKPLSDKILVKIKRFFVPSVSFRYGAQPYSVRKKSVFAHRSIFSAGSMHTSSIHLFSEEYSVATWKSQQKTIFSSLHTAVFSTTFSCRYSLKDCRLLSLSKHIISARTGLPILPKLSHVPPVHNQLSLHGSRSVSLQLYMHFRHRAQSCAAPWVEPKGTPLSLPFLPIGRVFVY